SIGLLENAVVGKVIGRRLPFFVLESEIRRQWGRFGDLQISTIGTDCFACTFDSLEARDAVLCGGPWFFSGNIVGLDRWTPEFSPSSLEGLSSPIWIRLPQLPLQYWDPENLIRIASMLGEPLWIDAQTGARGRREYARICIKLDLALKLQSGIWINGWKGRFYQRVEYEGLGLSCFECGRVGHRRDTCPSRPVRGDDMNADISRGVQPGAGRGGGSSSGSGSKSPESVAAAVVGTITPAPVSNCSASSSGSGSSRIGSAGSSQPASAVTREEMVKDNGPPDLTEDEKLFGPWSLVPPRKGRKQTKKTPASEPGPLGENIPRQVNLLEVKEPMATRMKENFRPSKGDKRPGLTPPLLFSAGARPTRPKLGASKAHFDKELRALGPIEEAPRKRRKDGGAPTSGGDASPIGV
ncbi:uncharacterized protein LOC110097390, partial [Dendrobium catenatum]|uniref:uncharacterized protein LOC110097390 n=1 Tax=Dendrobium catenatum TaxID=906689 RepID=UPI0009F28AA6